MPDRPDAIQGPDYRSMDARNRSFYNAFYNDATVDCRTDAAAQWHAREEDFYRAECAGEGRVLEIGCSEGRIVEVLAPVVGHVVGIEYVARVAAEAAQRFTGTRNVTIVEGDATAMPFPANHFDRAIIAFNTLGTASPESAEAMVREAWRTLKPGGVLMGTVYRREAGAAQAALYNNTGLTEFEVAHIGPDYVQMVSGFISRRFSAKALREVLGVAFHEVDVRPCCAMAWGFIATK